MAYFPEDFKKSYKDKLLELDNLERENATDKSSLIKRSNLQRNLARLVFHESVKLSHSSEATCHLLQSDVKKYEQLVHRRFQLDKKGPSDHLFMSDCVEMLDKIYPDGSYKKLKNKTWATSMSAETQIRNFDLPCRRAFLGCTEEELIDAENKIFGDDSLSKVLPATKPIPSTKEEIIDVKKSAPRSPPAPTSNVFRIFKLNKSVVPKTVENPKLLADDEPRAGSSNGNINNKWTAYENEQPDCSQRVEVSNSQAEISFPAKPSLKRRIETTDGDEVKDLPAQTAFHTGTEVLQQQLNARNAGRSGNYSSDSSSTSTTLVPVKKSLGGRRNVQSKFVPPFLQPTTPQSFNENPSTDVEMLDDRLKHIDPKMIELIRSEIMDTASTNVTWSDIAGLDYAKSTIKEAVVWPLLRPDIFTGLRRPPRGILLFGPPGTGKTLIGKCIASQSKSTFFSISASSLTSKWIGDGEKMVRALFAVASVHQPAVIFIDEIDSLLCQRSETEHESSRRLKTEFLIQLDGAATADDERILIVGATNRPQELDEAARRRLVKRLYIPLPETSARQQILRNLLQNERTNITSQQIDELGRLSNGFSGADMKTLCHEASMGPIRSIDMDQMEHIDLRDVRPVCYADFESALRRVRSSVSPNDLEQYLVWDRTYGSGADEK